MYPPPRNTYREHEGSAPSKRPALYARFRAKLRDLICRVKGASGGGALGKRYRVRQHILPGSLILAPGRDFMLGEASQNRNIFSVPKSEQASRWLNIA